MKKKILLKNIIFIFFFFMFFVLPDIILYLKQGIIISANQIYYEQNYIKNIQEFIFIIKDKLINSFLLLNNPIFLFFVGGAILQKILKEI